MFRKSTKGFTLVEMLVVITIIGILAAIAIPNIVKARNKAKEAEVRANLHTIQATLDNYYTDAGQYPAYIAGGNTNSWRVFHDRIAAVDPNLQLLVDPLIEKAYIKYYPRNPFFDEDAGINIHKVTDFGVTGDPDNPLGDPRFGDQGITMANVMDDPRFWDESRNPGEYELHFYNSRGAPDGTKVDYAFGGYARGGRSISSYWAGEFFYRAIGDPDLQQSRIPEGPANIWDFRIGGFEHYIMGVYGAQQTRGLDVIRLNGQGNYLNRTDDNFNYDVPLALPEVMGGGGTTEQPMPAFPYRDEFGKLAFGAPDGHPDGIILAMSTSGWKEIKQ
jgi:prepilin-type N-terminal cleavage/methylation domain-containing protein